MKKTHSNSLRLKQVHFKQWTNKAYAVFRSLGKQIKIGVLATDISERLSTKSVSERKTYISEQQFVSVDDFQAVHREPIEFSITELPLFLIFFLIFVTNLTIEACGHVGLKSVIFSIVYSLRFFNSYPLFPFLIIEISMISHETVDLFPKSGDHISSKQIMNRPLPALNKMYYIIPNELIRL